MQGKIIRRRGTVVAILLALALTSTLTGCGVEEKGHPAIDQMNDALIKGIATDKAMASGQSNAMAVPASVTQSLLPSLAITDVKQQPIAQRFNIQVSNMPAREFFMSLVEGTPYNIIISPEVEGNISLNLKQVTIQQVLDAVHDIYGYRYEYTPYGFEVFTAGIQTRIFTVNYLDVQRYGQSYTEIVSGESGGNSSGSGGNGNGNGGGSNNNGNNNNANNGGNNNNGTTSNNNANTGPQTNTNGQQISSSISTIAQANFWRTLKISLEAIIGKENGNSVVLNPAAGIVVVKATPEELNNVARYLDQTQSSMNREVIIDTQVLEVTLSDSFQAGVDWSLLGMHVSGMGTSIPGEAVPNSLPANLVPQSLPGNLGPFTQVMSLSGSVGNFSGVIHALSTEGNVQVLSNPRISTMNNQEAVIKVGQNQYYATGFNSDLATSTGSTPVQTQNVNLNPFFSGIALGVTPQIGANNVVTLHVHPMVSTVTADPQIFVVNGQTSSLSLALSKVRESDSIVRAKSGEMIILGGMMSNDMEEQNADVPFLGKIPYLGALFRRTNQTAVKTELIILMRPIVVDDNTWIDQLQDAKDQYQVMNKGYHFGSHPDVFGNLAETEYFNGLDRQQNLAEGEQTLQAAKAKQATEVETQS